MNTDNNQLEKRLWAAADELRANSKLKASEYSIPVLGLIFLRYADVKFAEAEKRSRPFINMFSSPTMVMDRGYTRRHLDRRGQERGTCNPYFLFLF